MLSIMERKDVIPATNLLICSYGAKLMRPRNGTWSVENAGITSAVACLMATQTTLTIDTEGFGRIGKLSKLLGLLYQRIKMRNKFEESYGLFWIGNRTFDDDSLFKINYVRNY